MISELDAQCVLCGEVVRRTATAAHLVGAHPTPVGGFVFHFDGERFVTTQPSMLISELQALMGDRWRFGYTFWQQNEGEQEFPVVGNAVDLRRSPHFWLVPPATY